MKILVRSLIISSIIILNTLLPANAGQTTQEFTTQQRTQVEKIVHDYLLNNPQIIVEAATKLQHQQESQSEQNAKQAIIAHSNVLFNSSTTPVIGNPKGKVTLVEFFDYQCPYCKRVESILMDLISKNPDLRVVLKEWPLFGETSDFTARAALAAMQQNKYLPFHTALMQAKGHFENSEQVLTIAKATNLDITKLQNDMNSKSVISELKTNLMLATNLGINGTPAFIIAKTPATGSTLKPDQIAFIPGIADLKTLQKAIEKVSK